MTSSRQRLAGIDRKALKRGEQTRLAGELGVSRARVSQILNEPQRPRVPHKLDGLLPAGMTLGRLAQEAGISYRWLSRILRPGPPVSERTIEKWAPRIAAVIGQPANVVAARLEGGPVVPRS